MFVSARFDGKVKRASTASILKPIHNVKEGANPPYQPKLNSCLHLWKNNHHLNSHREEMVEPIGIEPMT